MAEKTKEKQTKTEDELLKEIESLKKELNKKEKSTTKETKIPDDAEIEIECGINSTLSFFDKKGRVFYTAEFDGIGDTDVIEFGELKKIRSAAGNSKYLTKGLFIVKGAVDDQYDFEQIIKELRIKKYYEGKLHFGNAEQVMTKGSNKNFIEGMDEIKKKKSDMFYEIVDRFNYLYKKGLIKDVDKVNKMKHLVKKENSNISLFD